MKRRTLLMLSAALAAVGSLATVAYSGPYQAKTAPSGSASAAPPPPLPEVREPEKLPALDATPIPDEKSKTPTPDEWKTATDVKLTRTRGMRDCKAHRVREWLKVHCTRQLAGIRLIAGPSDGVLLWVVPRDSETFDQRSGGELIFPIRRGDHRVFELFALVFGDWGGGSSETTAYLEERWLEGEKSPTVALIAK